MKQDEIQALAGHRNVPPWVVKLVGDAVAKERERITSLLVGIDEREGDTENGWWETSFGATFGANILKQIKGEQ